MKDEFWEALEHLVSTSEIVIDRPKGSRHPRYPDVIYPLDYGYLAETTSPDGGGIDLWLGSRPEKSLNAIIVTVDVLKRDSEIKLLLGCTPAETRVIFEFLNTGAMRAEWRGRWLPATCAGAALWRREAG